MIGLGGVFEVELRIIVISVLGVVAVQVFDNEVR